jgi:carbamoyl-phosphate synthase small subunit
MSKKALLVLEDGSFYEGTSFGAESTSYGEVVFDTAMVGYQEMLTDPSFAGQIVVPTYPMIGNYGINKLDGESKQIQVRGFVVREYCPRPSHWQEIDTLQEYLNSNGIPGLSGIDTRALVRHLRSSGVMMGILTSEMNAEEASKALRDSPPYGTLDFIQQVTTEKMYQWKPSQDEQTNYHIVVVDMGLKYNIVRILKQLGCRITVVPATTDEKEILRLNPDGILLSPGPGDPALLDYLTKILKNLIGAKPIMGICLGHQLIAHAFGAKTYKLKFGHRGGNHPVRDLSTGRIYITTQNHGYAVDADSLKGDLEVSHVNSNDGTVEGLVHKELPIMCIQYHSEGAPGPQDNIYLFNRFIEMITADRCKDG